MPLVRIAHAADKPAATSKALSVAVHRSLVETFGVPEDDYFQIVTDHAAGIGIVSATNFLGIEHTPDLVIVQITCAEGRTKEQKLALYRAIASKAAEAAQIRSDDVIINLIETKRENWSFGGGLAPFA